MATKRKPTPAQIAARERFAAMARSGAFKKKAKRNPAKKRSKPDPFVLAEIERANAHWAKTFGVSPDLIEMIGARTKFLEGQGLSYKDAFQQAVAEARTKTGPFAILKSNPVKTKRNPRASNPIILVSDKAIATKRKANPVKRRVMKEKRPFYYVVKVGQSYDGQFLSSHYTLEDVKKIAQQKADKYGAQAKITEFHS